MVNLFDALAKRVAIHGERTAITDGEGTTYQQFFDRACQIGRELRSFDVANTEPIGVLADHGTPMLIAITAVWAAGRIAVPLDKRWKPSVMAERLAHSGATMLLCDDEAIADMRSRVPSVQRVVSMHACDLQQGSPMESPDQPFAVIFATSGTSGCPKGVLHSHQTLLHNASNHSQLLKITHEDRGLLLANASTISGMTDSLRILLNGGTLVPYDMASGGLTGLLDVLSLRRPTIVHFVPTVFRRLCAMLEEQDSTERAQTLDAVRIVHLGGETVTRGDFERFRRLFPDDAVLLHNMGCTEVPSFRQTLMGKTWVPMSSAIPLERNAPGTCVELVDRETGAMIEDSDRPGEIVVCSRQTAVGYWQNDELTSQKFRVTESGGIRYFTGDLAHWTLDRALIHLGRMDDQVKLLGRTVSLKNVEDILMAHPEVTEAAVVPVQTDSSTKLVAFCSGLRSLNQSALQRWAREAVEAWHVPQCVVLPELPMLPNWKIDRQQLKNLAESKVIHEVSSNDGPETETEIKLARIWSRLLNLPAVGRNARFTDLGGDSLHVVELLAEIEREFGRRLTVSDVYREGTLERMARLLDRTVVSTQTPRYVEVFRPGRSPVLVIGYGETARAVADGIADDHGVVFLKIPGLHDRRIRFRSIASSVASYVTELNDLEISDPAAIIGFSYGGLLAYALAHELRRGGARPRVTLLIEPATPRLGKRRLPPAGESVSQMDTATIAHPRRIPPPKTRRRLWQKLMRPANWSYLFRYTRMLIANEWGDPPRGGRAWELFRPVIRWNTRSYSAPAYEGDVVLAGSFAYLNAHLPTWRRLNAGAVHSLELGREDRHDAYLDRENQWIWLQVLRDHLQTAPSPETPECWEPSMETVMSV